jgi:hypothetical protein
MYLYEQQILVTLGVVPQGQGVYNDIPGYPADMHEPHLASCPFSTGARRHGSYKI